MSIRPCGLDSLAAGAACFDNQGLQHETLDKDEALLCIVQNLFLAAQGLDDIPEPVVIRQNNDFNIFRLIQQSLRKEFRVNAEKFWGLVKKVHGGEDPSKEIWRPRFQGSQLKCLGVVRYPRTGKEWDRLSAALRTIGPALVPRVKPAAFVHEIRSFVDNFGNLWRSERRHKYKRHREIELDPSTVRIVEDRLLETEFQSEPRPDHVLQMGTMTTAQEIDMNTHTYQVQGTHLQSGEQTSQTESQDTGIDKVIALVVVGGKEFTTTIATLHSVPGSFFSKLIKFCDGASEFFVDRSPQMFEYVLGYLRATRYNEPLEHCPLPDSIPELKLLWRESIFYRLPDLAFLVEERIEKRKFPKIDIVILETPPVASEQALQQELQLLSHKANCLMEAKVASDGTPVERIDITSQDITVHEHGSNLMARVALILQNH